MSLEISAGKDGFPKPRNAHAPKMMAPIKIASRPRICIVPSKDFEISSASATPELLWAVVANFSEALTIDSDNGGGVSATASLALGTVMSQRHDGHSVFRPAN